MQAAAQATPQSTPQSTPQGATQSAAQAAAQTAARTQALQTQLAQRGLTFRPPPPLPTTCCGRGCNGCVWEGYYAAVEYWLQGAQDLLAQRELLRDKNEQT